jgi:hypothetical protein
MRLDRLAITCPACGIRAPLQVMILILIVIFCSATSAGGAWGHDHD